MLHAHVSSNLISGLIEAVAATPYNGNADLPDIASDLQMEVDELFPVAEALQMLRLGELEGGDIKLTHMGKRFADAELNERKEIFSRALMTYVPLAAHIRRVLDERASHTAPQAPLHRRTGRPHDGGCGGGNAARCGQLGAGSANFSPTTTKPRASVWRIRRNNSSWPGLTRP